MPDRFADFDWPDPTNLLLFNSAIVSYFNELRTINTKTQEYPTPNLDEFETLGWLLNNNLWFDYASKLIPELSIRKDGAKSHIPWIRVMQMEFKDKLRPERNTGTHRYTDCLVECSRILGSTHHLFVKSITNVVEDVASRVGDFEEKVATELERVEDWHAEFVQARYVFRRNIGKLKARASEWSGLRADHVRLEARVRALEDVVNDMVSANMRGFPG